MIDQQTIEHHIQKHIISVLMHQKYARFRDMRPAGVDTNLYSYHLKLLQRNGFVTKTLAGYMLDKNGLLFVDRVSTSSLKVRTQPKIITMLVIQNSNDEILLFRRKRQPYTDTWTLPYGKLHIDDVSLSAAASREADEKLGMKHAETRHVGDCYIRIHDNDAVVMSTLAHIFYMTSDTVAIHENLQWVQPRKLGAYDLAPAVEQIMARVFFHDPYFFEEYSEELVQ